MRPAPMEEPSGPRRAERLAADARQRHFEKILGRTLWIGVIVSTSLLAAGLAWWFAAPQSGGADRLLRAGLIALMLVPVTRLLVSLVEFILEGDWTFAAIVLGVLGVLGGTLWVALH